MLLTILLTFHILVCIALIVIVLLQRSEGGALGMGGGPSGFMTARGAGDLLTRTTWILFAIFLTLSVGLTLLNARAKNSTGLHIDKIDPSALGGAKPPAAQPGAPGQAAPTPGAPAPSLPSNPSTGLPGPLTAPGPALRLPASPQPIAPAPAPAPAAPAKK
jgi:preprotein translocase subunit SecG